MTHTFVELSISKKAFDEIKKKLKKAGYTDLFIDDVIDMHGIALKKQKNTHENDI